MYITIIIAILLSALLYLYMGFTIGKSNKKLGDIFPIVFGGNARVETVNEFASSTTATSISLATIILAYFELAGYFGLWLLWTVLTTITGMYIVKSATKRIWTKLSDYDHRPSMHEFIGREFNSNVVALVASSCTSIGFLLIFATELVVGSRFLVSLIPAFPSWIVVVFLSLVGFVYTVVGGFRVVIKTDQLQMKFIWLFIISMFTFYFIFAFQNGGIEKSLSKVPNDILSFSSKPGLFFFLLGISILNIPGYLSNMSIWQRITGSFKSEIVNIGISKSIWNMALSWSFLSILACLAYIIVIPQSNQTLLAEVLTAMGSSIFGNIILFIVVIGLYGAMLSTASTILIVVGHTVSEDIIAKIRKHSLSDRLNSNKEIKISRLILILATLLAVFLVEGLNYIGFSIADLVFAIYGGALCLFPLIIISLYTKKEKLIRLDKFASVAAIMGFLSGWGVAIYGRTINDSNLIFLSPGFSILVSGTIIWIGLLFYRTTKK